jgi:hypothetical protein
MATISGKWLTSLALLGLCGCGAGAVDGVYRGTLSGGSNPNFEAIFLEDGSVWVIAGTDLGSSFQVSELWMGTGSSIEGTFPPSDTGKYTSSDIRNFSATGAPQGSLTARYSGAITSRELNGSAKFTGASTLELSGKTIAGTSYSYENPALLTDVSGSWTLTGGATVTFTVSATGVVTWTDSSLAGCAGNGNITPRASGKNIYSVSITFGAQGCQFSNQTVTGIALSYPITSTGQRQLFVALVDADRKTGMVRAGIR